MKVVVALINVFLILTISGIAEAPDSLKFKVGFSIAADSSLDPRIRSYLSRELRELGDVEVVNLNEKPHFILNLNMYEIPFADGRRTGSLSIYQEILRIHYPQAEFDAVSGILLSNLKSKNLSKDCLDEINGAFQLYRSTLPEFIGENVTGNLLLIGTGRLKEYSEEFIALFDSKVLAEIRRKSRETTKEIESLEREIQSLERKTQQK